MDIPIDLALVPNTGSLRHRDVDPTESERFGKHQSHFICNLIGGSEGWKVAEVDGLVG